MPDVKAIYNQGLRGYQSAMVEAEGRFRQAQLDDDLAGATEAAMQINALRAQMASWDRLAQEATRQQQPSARAAAQRNRFGLSDDEVEVAHTIGQHARGPDGRPLTNEQREQLYAEKKGLYHQKLADGSYSRQIGFGKMG